jgi:hypothetical protein
MNLHGIASGAIGAVNPFIPVVIQQSLGTYTTQPDGKRVPDYATIHTTGQEQALSGGDIQRLNSLNVQGVVTKMYLNGNYEGVFREDGKGGDLMTFRGRTYLVSAVLERWPTWCCVALTMQVTP